MEPYKNLGGNSNIVTYQTGLGFVDIKFGDNSIYRYTNASAGVANVRTMKELAQKGQGLNSFINTEVRQNYESKKR